MQVIFSKMCSTISVILSFDAFAILTFVIWLFCQMCGWPYTGTRTLPPACGARVSALWVRPAGGRGLRQGTDGGGCVEGGRAPRQRHSENTVHPVASAGWEQAKSWCRAFLLPCNKHCITLLVGEFAPAAQCGWKLQRQTCCLCGCILVLVEWLVVGSVDWQNYSVRTTNQRVSGMTPPHASQHVEMPWATYPTLNFSHWLFYVIEVNISRCRLA